MVDQLSNANIYTDFAGLAELRAEAREDSDDARRMAAEQFEAFFMQMMLKSMRDSISKSDLFGSSHQDMFTNMFDQQLSLQASGNKSQLGLADIIYEQLGGKPDVKSEPLNAMKFVQQMNVPAIVALESADSTATGKLLPKEVEPTEQAETWRTREEFIQHILPTAKSVAEQLKIQPEAILAVAALETQWGEKVIQRQDGSSSFNLFGIKANAGWAGQQAFTPTLEFENGAMVRRTEGFRAYESVQESISDFKDFLQSNSRYTRALQSGQESQRFFTELQEAGYATDPEYANKLMGVLEGKTLRNTLKNISTSALIKG